MTITEFLLARIAEDEHEARKAGSFTPWDRTFDRDNYGQLLVQPSRVLAECEAKRQIVVRCSEMQLASQAIAVHLASRTLADLALPYADHPDYREEWR